MSNGDMDDDGEPTEARLLHDLIDALPVCSACDSAPATNVLDSEQFRDFYGCDDHRSPGAVDLPWAEQLRAAQRALGIFS